MLTIAKEQGVAEGSNDTIYPNAEVIKSKNGRPVGEIYQDGNSWGCFHYRADRGYDMIDTREDAIEALKDLHQETGRSRPDYTFKGVAESVDAEAYKQKLLSSLPQMMRFFAKNVQGWKPSREQMLAAIETGYTVMKHTGDVKQAGRAVMDELNTLHRMSQGDQGVAEGDKTKFLDSGTVRRIQNFLNKKYDANLDVDGVMGPLTIQSIKKFIPNSQKKLAPRPDLNTKVQGKQTKSPQQIDEKCWDTHRQVGMKKKGNRMVPDCVPK